jgi:hypothetical protein
MNSGAIQFNRNNVNAISPIINIVSNPKSGIIYTIVLLASLIGIFVTLWVSDLGDFVKPFFIILSAAYAGAPLLLLILENLIPLIVAIVIGIIAVVIIGMSLSDDGKSGEGEKESGGSLDNSQTTKPKSGKQPIIKNSYTRESGEKKVNTGILSELVIENTCAYVPDLNGFLGFKLFKVHGWTEDYIESYNGVATRRICNLEQFQKGKFHIYESKSGREVKDSDIPWRKQN